MEFTYLELAAYTPSAANWFDVDAFAHETAVQSRDADKTRVSRGETTARTCTVPENDDEISIVRISQQT